MTGPARAPREVACPACGKPVPWSEASPHRPFCSPRCKGLDLGAWASEQYRVPATSAPDTEPEPAQPPR